MLQRQFVDEIYRDGRLNKINNIMICIYKIANNVNDKIYIGQTKFFNVGNTAISNSISRGSKLLKVNSLRYTETAD